MKQVSRTVRTERRAATRSGMPLRLPVLTTERNRQYDPVANEALQRFHRAFSPFEHPSVIVAQELRAGVKRPRDRKALERNVLRVFERASRTITPSPDAWHRAGDLLSDMAKQEGLEIARVSKAFANDILLALSCRESGCVLVTENDRDFSRIRQFTSFEYMKPWPPYDLRLVDRD